MSLLEEVKTVESEVKTEVTNVETKVENAVAAVEAKTEGEVKAVVDKAKKFATEAKIKITDAENLALTKMENEFLKAQMDFRMIQDKIKAIQEAYPKQIAELVKKYTIDETTHIFNAIEGAFTKKN